MDVLSLSIEISEFLSKNMIFVKTNEISINFDELHKMESNERTYALVMEPHSGGLQKGASANIFPRGGKWYPREL